MQFMIEILLKNKISEMNVSNHLRSFWCLQKGL